MKRICCTLLAAALLLSACTAASAQSSGQSLSELFEGIQKDEPASVDTYVLGADELASIPAIVGQREWVPPLPGEGEHHYAYRSGTVSGDLIAYIDYLGGLGFEVVRGASLSEPGDGELVAASKDAGQQLHVGADGHGGPGHAQVRGVQRGSHPGAGYQLLRQAGPGGL